MSRVRFVSSLRKVILSLDPEQPVYDVQTMDEVVGRSLAQRRLSTVMLGTFASISLALASLGIYGVIAYSVTQRVREIGIRLALGAEPRDVVGMVLRQGAVLAALGTTLGLSGALVLTRQLRTLLYNVPPTDWVSFGAGALLLAAVALLASFLPARRASRVDPIVALRHE